jgi:predicted esterase
MILLHGRGGTAESMHPLADELARPDFAYIAPRAPGHSWYPKSFLAPIAQNEPHLSRSLASVSQLVDELRAEGFGAERLVLLGFSQGGCLALEYAARHARRFGAVIGLSAGLIGPAVAQSTYSGSFGGTRMLLGCSDVDPHIPVSRVRESGRVLGALGADVDVRIYAGMAHTINGDEIVGARALLARVGARIEAQSVVR